jgi:hypothetical protein
MNKLLTEPRLIKRIAEPKKKTRRKKLTPEEKELLPIKYTVIREIKNPIVDELFRLYKESPYKARVKTYNSRHSISFNRTVLFEKGDEDFEICNFQNTFGISVTNKMYSGQKKISSISYKNGKFWSIDKFKSNITPLTYNKLLSFIYCHEGKTKAALHDSMIFTFFLSRFPWIKMLEEHQISSGVNLNVVKAKKLFSSKDINRHVLGVPNNIANMIIESNILQTFKGKEGGKYLSEWKELSKYLDGIQNLTLEMLKSHYFVDSCRMARTLGKKVNCRWGAKRLKEEHDAWAREIGNIVLDCEEEYDLKVKPVYHKFAEYSGYKLLKTNKDMLIEGMMQDHCVGTYIDRVDRGECAIFHVEGYTLQVKEEVKKASDILHKKMALLENMLYAGNRLIGYDGINIDTEEIPKDETMLTMVRGQIDDLKLEIEAANNLPRTYTLTNQQFRGKHNSNPPQELVDMVNARLLQFGLDGKFEELDIKSKENKAEPIVFKPKKLIAREERYGNLDEEFGGADLLF